MILCTFSHIYLFFLRPFASLYQLRVHTETHARQNNLKFSCSMCGASYARAFALKDHIKQVHNRDADKVDSLVSTLFNQLQNRRFYSIAKFLLIKITNISLVFYFVDCHIKFSLLKITFFRDIQ